MSDRPMSSASALAAALHAVDECGDLSKRAFRLSSLEFFGHVEREKLRQAGVLLAKAKTLFAQALAPERPTAPPPANEPDLLSPPKEHIDV